jgi:hypothetical protein
MKLPLGLNIMPWRNKVGGEVKLHTFLTLLLDRQEWSTSHSKCLIPEDWFHLTKRLDHYQNQYGHCDKEKHLCPCQEFNLGSPAYSQPPYSHNILALIKGMINYRCTIKNLMLTAANTKSQTGIWFWATWMQISTLQPSSLKSTSVLSCYLFLGLPSGQFVKGFPAKILSILFFTYLSYMSSYLHPRILSSL